MPYVSSLNKADGEELNEEKYKGLMLTTVNKEVEEFDLNVFMPPSL